MWRGVQNLAVKADRLALLALFIETFETPQERRHFIEKLCSAQIMSPASADLLREEYGLGCEA